MFQALFSRPRRVFAAIAIVCAGMLAFGVLYLQMVLNLNPCPMCIVQRYCLILVGVFSALAAFSGKAWGWRLWGLLGLGTAGFGAFTAADNPALPLFWDLWRLPFSTYDATSPGRNETENSARSTPAYRED